MFRDLSEKGIKKLTSTEFEPDPWQLVKPENLEYLDTLDTDRLGQLKDYEAKDSGVPLQAVVDEVNFSTNFAYSVKSDDAPFRVDMMHRYEELVAFVSALPKFSLKSARDIESRFPKIEGFECNIRHDVDVDIVAACQMAHIEDRYNGVTTHFMLHTSRYYGKFARPAFLRNESTSKLYHEIQDANQEVALHTDSMTLYQYCNMDGAKSLTTELDWLRSQGLDIKGTVAHNNASVYGCENYSIFKGRKVKPSMKAGPMGVLNHGRWAPLQLLDEQELGLEYEANDLFHQRKVPLFYAATRGLNRWNCVYEPACFDDREKPTMPRNRHWHSQDEVMDMLAQLVEPCYVILAVHPVYYGGRIEDSDPWRPTEPTDVEENGMYLWSGFNDGKLEAAAINCRNELGQLDLPIAHYKKAKTKMIMMSPFNATSKAVCADARFAQMLGWELSFPPYRSDGKVISLETPDPAKTDLAEYLDGVRTKVGKEDIIFLGLDTASPEVSKIIKLAESYAEQDQSVVLFIDGHADGATAPSPAVIKQIQSSTDLEIHNPYEVFADYNGCGKTILKSHPSWGEHGHVLVYRMLFDIVVRECGLNV